MKRSPGKKAESVISPHPPQKLCADELLLLTMLHDRVSLEEVLNFLVSLSIIPSDYWLQGDLQMLGTRSTQEVTEALSRHDTSLERYPACQV